MDQNLLLIERTILALIGKNYDSAQKHILQIDEAELAEQRLKAFSVVKEAVKQYVKPNGSSSRTSVKNIDKVNTFERDKYTCRYCQRLTINPLVLREISRVIPDVFPYHLHWKSDENHLLYWIYASSIEHRISFPNGGTSDADNLVTSCYLCNDIKKHYPLELLGWELHNPSLSDWDGFTKYLCQLEQVEETVNYYARATIKSHPLPKRSNSDIDLKTLPVGTIARNIKTGNFYIVLEKTEKGVKYFSHSENMILTILTKVLLTSVEFQPKKIYSSIREIVEENYSVEQLEIIRQAIYKLK